MRLVRQEEQSRAVEDASGTAVSSVVVLVVVLLLTAAPAASGDPAKKAAGQNQAGSWGNKLGASGRLGA